MAQNKTCTFLLYFFLAAICLDGALKCLWAGERNGRAPGRLRPDEVLVLANRASDDSMEVARHYMKTRGIPKDHIFTIQYEDFGELTPMDQNPKWFPFDRFRDEVVEPLEQLLEEKGWRQQILCFVTVYGTPYRVGGFELTEKEKTELVRKLMTEETYREASPEKKEEMFEKRKRNLWRANSAFDSELATLFEPAPPENARCGYGRRQRLNGPSKNPYFAQSIPFRTFRQQQLADEEPSLLYMVARIDGLSAQNAKGLVDKAVQAEKEGVSGTAYFDARSEGKKKKGYGVGDWWIRRAWEITKKAGIKTIRNTNGGMFGPGECPDALIYWGFYHPFKYNGKIFNNSFPTGAIACHIASFEAANIHRAKWGKEGENMPWCSGFLRDGVTVTIGPVAEPYLQAFPHTPHFFSRLYSGWSMGETYWTSIAHTSWRMILVGDPLYVPFEKGADKSEP
ncbi:MAG: TIGR03790 family protein [Candidatus Brocadiia bacterium]